MDLKLGITLNYINSILIVFPLVLGSLRYNKMVRSEKLFFGFILATFITTAIAYYTYTTGTKNNIYLSHIFTPVKFGVLAMALFPSNSSKLLKYVLYFLILAILVVAALEAFAGPESVKYYNSITKSTSGILIIFLSIRLLLNLRQDELIDDLAQTPLFWIGLGLAIYYSSNLVIFAFQKLVQQSSMDTLLKMGIIQQLIYSAVLVIFLIAFFKIKRSRVHL